jgi:hypothetical protein
MLNLYSRQISMGANAGGFLGTLERAPFQVERLRRDEGSASAP